MRRRLPLLLLVLFAVLVAPARAADLGTPHVAVADGRTTVAWLWTDAKEWHVRIADAGADGAFGPEQTVVRSTSPVQVDGLVSSASGDLLVVWRRFDTRPAVDGKPAEGYVEGALRAAGGAFGPVMALSDGPAENGTPLTVAMGRRGHALVGWRQAGAARVLALEPGGAFKPVAAPDGLMGPFESAVSDDGEAVLGGRTCVRFDCQVATALRGPGVGFGAARGLSEAPPFDDGQAVAMGPRGDALLVTGPNTTRQVLAFRRAPGSEFGAADSLDGDFRASRTEAGVAADGSAVALWQRHHDFAGREIAAATAEPGRPFGPPQVLDATGSDLRLGVDAGGGATAAWTTFSTENGATTSRASVRIARRAPGQPFGAAEDVHVGTDLAWHLRLATGGGAAALTWREEGREAIRIFTATARPGAPAAVRVLAEVAKPREPRPAEPAARVPAQVKALARRGGVARVPVACEGAPCEGMVALRAGGRTRRVPFSLTGWNGGTWVKVPVARRARRAEVRITTGGRPTDRRVLVLRRTAAPACPSVPWARVLDRRQGTVVTVRFDDKLADTRTRVFSCAGGRERLLATFLDDINESTGIKAARAGARSVALVIGQGGRDKGGSERLQLHDARTGAMLGFFYIGSTEAFSGPGPVYGVSGLRLTSRGDAVAIVRNGRTVQVRALLRNGDTRVLDAGPDVEPGTLSVAGTSVRWRADGQPRSAEL